MMELFPEGFEECEGSDGLELAAYTDWRGEERLWQVFGAARADPVVPDWLDRWRTFHRPVRIGPLWIGPPWLEPPPEAIGIVIEPGRAFGTGAHPTTRLCIELLLGVERGSLLDVGCGSGVIAVAAAKLGFAPVAAVDVDPAAVEAACANAEANAVLVHAKALDALDPAVELPASDTTIANIALEPVRRLAERIESARLVTSGYLAADEPALPGFGHLARAEAEGWAADLFSRE